MAKKLSVAIGSYEKDGQQKNALAEYRRDYGEGWEGIRFT